MKITQTTILLLNSGLEIVMYLDQENYMLNKQTQNAGAKVVVHDSSLPPLLEEFAIDVQPNNAILIGVQTVSDSSRVEV